MNAAQEMVFHSLRKMDFFKIQGLKRILLLPGYLVLQCNPEY